jgi:ATP-binding cassette subfamily B protein
MIEELLARYCFHDAVAACDPRARVALVGLLVLAAAAFELAPPLIIRAIVDGHLLARSPDGVPALALAYLLAVAAMQAMTFLYGYLAATGAQAMLSDLRTRLFAHLVRLPTSFFDRTPAGDTISSCTADVDTLDNVFSSGVAVLLANLVRLATIADHGRAQPGVECHRGGIAAPS